MHVNNETGVEQPIASIADGLGDSQTIFHTDAAQGFGKSIVALKNKRIDLISISAHKIYGPKGIGALIKRRREGFAIELQPLMLGGGQERGLRAGTAPVPLIVGLGVAAELAEKGEEERSQSCQAYKQELLDAFVSLDPVLNGNPDFTLPNAINMSFPGVDSEALMLVLRDYVAISNGSACTSAEYSPSHVLKAMGLTDEQAETATRWSWSHMTPAPDWEMIIAKIRQLL
jgi:cysteine desulfurase